MGDREDPLDETRDDGGAPCAPFAGDEVFLPGTTRGSPRPSLRDAVPLPRDTASACSPAEILRALGLPPERFAVEQELGAGHSGTVYAIHDKYLDRTIAVKYAPSAVDGPQVARFVHEARVAASVEHPNIVPVFHLDQSTSGRFYLAMRRIKGQSLGDVIDRSVAEKRRHALIATPNDVVNIAVKLCDAVACAHARGVIHQDIKPDNIMLGEFGEVLLIDWGTASSSSTKGRRGTPTYMAPEQARGEGAEARSDVYGIGATMFHALFLRYPTKLGDAEDFWRRKKRGEIELPGPDERRSVPARLTAIVLKALEPDPERRYPSVGALTRDLHALQSGMAVSAYRESLSERLVRWYRLRYRMCNAILGMLALLLAVSGFYLYDLDRARRAEDHARLEAFELKEQRTTRWNLVLKQDFEREKSLDPRLKPDHPFQFKDDGLPLGFDSPLKELVWTEPIGVEQKVEVTFSCDAIPSLLIDLCRNAGGSEGTSLSFYSRQVHIETTDPSWRTCAFSYTSEESSIRYDGRNTVVIWREGQRFFMEVNGVRALEYHQSTAPWSEEYGHFRLSRSGPYGPLTIHSLRVWRRVSPDYVSVLEPGKTLLRKGDAQAARAWFETHRHSRLSEEVGKEAEYLIVQTLSMAETAERERLLAAIVEDEQHPFRAHAMHDLALLLLETERWQETLDMACRAARLAPELGTINAVPWILYARLKTLPQEEKAAVVERICKLSLPQLSFPDFGLTDLTLLKDRGVQVLHIRNNPLASLDPLQGERLRELDLGPAPVHDLGPLKGMPLEQLIVRGLPVSDLAPLQGMPLQCLKLESCPEIDFRTLRGVRTRLLHIDGGTINDRSVLASTEARILRVINTSLPDIQFAASLPLHVLVLKNTGLVDIEPLRNSKLVKCVLLGNRIENIEPLFSCSRLEDLNLSGNPVRDLTPLRKLPLAELDLSNTKVRDLSPLAGLPLEYLNLAGTAVQDLRVLASLPCLKRLDVRRLALDDEALRVLAGLSVTSLEIDLNRRSLGVLGRMTTPKRIGPFVADYIHKVGPALAEAFAEAEPDRAQVPGLRALATRGHEVERLLVPVPLSYAAASAMSRALGGTLACPSTRREAAELAEYLGTVGHKWDLQIWIGLESREGALTFQSGASVAWAVSYLLTTDRDAVLRGAHLLTSGGLIGGGRSPGSSVFDSKTVGESVERPFVVEWRTPR